MQISEIKNNKSSLGFGIINKFYCRIFEQQNKNLSLISDFRHIFIGNNNDNFCEFCFEFDYLNYIAQEELVGNFIKQDLDSSNVTTYFTSDFSNKINKIISKKLALIDGEFKVFDFAANKFAASLKLNKHPVCTKCNHDKIKEFNKENLEELLTISDKFLKSFLNDRGMSNTNLNDKIKELILGFNSLIAYFDTFELRDLGFKHYFSSLLSVFAEEKSDKKLILSLGQHKNKLISKIKALMEFAERYALKNRALAFTSLKGNKLDIMNACKDMKYCGKDDEEKEVIITSAIDVLAGKNVILRVGKEKLDFIKSSNGMSAHCHVKGAAINSVLELIERDAFVRWWIAPENFTVIKAWGKTLKLLNNFKKFAIDKTKNESIEVKLLSLQSPLNVNVVLSLISSKDSSLPPAIVIGAASGFDLEETIEKSLLELYSNFLNVVCKLQNEPDFFKNEFDYSACDSIKSPIDHGMLYYHPALIKELIFLPLVFSASEVDIRNDKKVSSYEEFKKVLEDQKAEWYLLNMTPPNFKGLNIFALKSIVPQLKEIIFGEDSKKYFDNIDVSKYSVAKKLPHCFS